MCLYVCVPVCVCVCVFSERLNYSLILDRVFFLPKSFTNVSQRCFIIFFTLENFFYFVNFIEGKGARDDELCAAPGACPARGNELCAAPGAGPDRFSLSRLLPKCRAFRVFSASFIVLLRA